MRMFRNGFSFGKLKLPQQVRLMNSYGCDAIFM